jgi:hypothetical protein
MSVFAMAKLAAARQQQDWVGRERLKKTRYGDGASASHPGATEDRRSLPGQTAEVHQSAEAVKQSALEKLASFVPTEVITAWAAAVGLIVPTAHWQRWLIFVAAFVAMIILLRLNLAIARKQLVDSVRRDADDSTRKLLKLCVISGVAFTVWAFAAPGSPAMVWGEAATRVFAVLALVVTPLLHRLAQLWGLAPLEST